MQVCEKYVCNVTVTVTVLPTMLQGEKPFPVKILKLSTRQPASCLFLCWLANLSCLYHRPL